MPFINCCAEIPISASASENSGLGAPQRHTFLLDISGYRTAGSENIPMLGFPKCLHKLTLPPVVYEHVSYVKSLSKLAKSLFILYIYILDTSAFLVPCKSFARYDHKYSGPILNFEKHNHLWTLILFFFLLFQLLYLLFLSLTFCNT